MVDEPDPQVQAVLEFLSQSTIGRLQGRGLAVSSAREAMGRAFEQGPDEPVGAVEQFEIEGPDGSIPVRLYLPEDGDGDDGDDRSLVVYYHGGGFVLGDLDSADGVCRRLVNEASCVVCSVDYRLAPEHPFPAGFEDAYAAAEWASEQADALRVNRDKIAVAGDSAGGNFAAAVALAARDRDGPDLAHQFLIYPAVRSPVQPVTESMENAEGYLLDADAMEWFDEQYHVRPSDARNEYAHPLLARDLSDLPPATVVTAGFDPLRDEGIAYADRLSEDGVSVEHRDYEAMVHGFADMLGVVDTTDEFFAYAGERLRSAFEGE
ncbi:alpha/beta hydrolase (plasmid) [Haladaptatus sp. SPP-AMP-3]|uniref:alpha/beta hydrolase n=1 Tax=Haladaptatus sp. SPP-AMP-3 TaxID=3121295 RepID=UPI003C2FC915